MIDWIIKNREWLFSGIGVATLVGLAAFIRRGFTKHTSSPEATAPSIGPDQSNSLMTLLEAEGYSQRPSQWDIQSAIDSSPPYQQPAKPSSYAGLKVLWLTTFRSCTDRGNGKVMISMTDPKGTRWVYIDELEIERYPQLKITHAGARILFAGTIVKIEPRGIVVVPEKLRIMDSA